MPMFMQSMFGRWRALRKRHHAERDMRAALFELNDHLRRDIGFQPRRSAGNPWL